MKRAVRWPFLDRRSDADLEAVHRLQDQAMAFWSAGLGAVEPAEPAPEVGASQRRPVGPVLYLS